MNTMPTNDTAHDQYLIAFGKSAAIGVFTAPDPVRLKRGAKAVLQTARGVEIGTVLYPATLRQARLLGAMSSGTLLRAATALDAAEREKQAAIEQVLFDAGRAWARRDGLSLEILDVELLFDGAQAILQFVGNDSETEKLAQTLESEFHLAIRFENIAAPRLPPEEEPRCSKPDCGSTAGGGGCTSCSTGGGCSSCGTSKVDMRDYFGHLRTKMENRIPLA